MASWAMAVAVSLSVGGAERLGRKKEDTDIDVNGHYCCCCCCIVVGGKLEKGKFHFKMI